MKALFGRKVSVKEIIIKLSDIMAEYCEKSTRILTRHESEIKQLKSAVAELQMLIQDKIEEEG